MRALNTIHTQDLNDVLAAARLCLCEFVTATQTEMFRALFGALFCEVGAHFGDRIAAYEANKKRVPEVLGAIAVELEARHA